MLARAANAPLGLVILLGSLSAFGPVGIDLYLPGMPAMARELGASAGAAQFTISIFFLGLAIGHPIYGPISDRMGRRPPLLFGVALFVLGTLGCALAPTMNLLLVSRLIQALGGCGGMVVARAVVRDRFAHDEVLHVFALLTLVIGLAPILAPLVGGALLLVGDWRWIFGVQCAFGVAAGFAVYAYLPESRSAAAAARAEVETILTSYLTLLKQRKMVGYVLSGASGSGALMAYVASSPDIVITQFHISAQNFGWVFGANAIGLIGANQLNARLARRHPSEVILGGALMTALAISLALAVFAWTGFGGVWGILIPLFLIITCFGFVQPNATAGALNLDPLRAGSVASLVGSAFFGAGALGSAAAGWFRNGTALPMCLVIVASVFLGALSFARAIRTADRHRDRPVFSTDPAGPTKAH